LAIKIIVLENASFVNMLKELTTLDEKKG